MAKVYIGVGHGGADPGAVSGSHKEKAYALDIATACTAELKRHGVQVMQSRTSDVTESAAAKIKECNAYNPDLALDIHLNAGGGDGSETYHSVIRGEGEELAESIEMALTKIGQNSRGVKIKKNSAGKDYFGFIRQTNCPAILVECAFIDSKDVQIIDTLAERQKMGKAVAHGVLAYLEIAVKVASTASAQQPVKQPTKVTIYVPTLRKGDKGEFVKSLQLLLVGNGYSCGDAGFDGDFGNATQNAVKSFQKDCKLTIDGIVGEKTWAALLG